jgi:hypothetical protein
MRFLTLVSLLALSAPAFAADFVNIDLAPMQGCATDSECVLVEPECPGPWYAINRSHEASYNANLPNVMARANCLHRPPENKPAMPPVCRSGKCAPAGSKAQ